MWEIFYMQGETTWSNRDIIRCKMVWANVWLWWGQRCSS